MAESGTGRGRTAFTFNIDALGFGRGAALPETVSKPPPTYPSTENKPVPLKTGEDEDYMLALKQDLRATMKQMPYFLAVEEDREVIERYRKKYQNSEKERQTWTPDWRRLPREVKPKKKTKKSLLLQSCEPDPSTAVGAAGANPKKAKSLESKSNLDVLKKIEELEKKDDEEEESEDEEDRKEDKPKDKEGGDDDDDEEEPEEDDEEEHEEENDYISSYFEDGDDFGDGSDDNMDEATY
ncbi:DNA-directed RNA polymerase III subunit RPC7 [Accipiter gentilis]|uniref:DNA-directed RNA polymerase III subunit RPC7 n=1 Tax=Astur gentilis TaxID=8957 RepID=UPI002110BC97|nr:DNA-directed RNA polymerase III subunit RPC7 [Accipiter gentilis]